MQKGFSVAEVMAFTEPEAAALIDVLTDKPGTDTAKRYIARRKPKKAK